MRDVHGVPGLMVMCRGGVGEVPPARFLPPPSQTCHAHPLPAACLPAAPANSAPPPRLPPQAEHESSVTGLALSPDGLRLAIGTEAGTLGVLHVPTHAYATLLRSHCGAVNAVAADPNR